MREWKLVRIICCGVLGLVSRTVVCGVVLSRAVMVLGGGGQGVLVCAVGVVVQLHPLVRKAPPPRVVKQDKSSQGSVDTTTPRVQAR